MTRYYLLLTAFVLFPLAARSQTLVLDPATTVVDPGTGLILAHIDLADRGAVSRLEIGGRAYDLSEPAATLAYSESYSVTDGTNDLQLYFTRLPLLLLTTTEPVMEDDRVDFSLRCVGPQCPGEMTGGVEFRGNSDGPNAKNSLDLEFDDDATFFGLREDDDWTLDALNNEPLKVNSYLSHALWLDMYRLPYAEDEPEAKAGAQVRFVEVAVNGAYYGLMLLSEELDRKQLKLKKPKDGERRGELYQGDKDRKATRFEVDASVPDNTDKDWSGWDYEYPDEDDFPVDWNNLYAFYQLVTDSDDGSFETRVTEAYDLQNAADYLLFGNVVNAENNFSENLYLARYDDDTPYFTVPWDLDNTFGNGDAPPSVDSANVWWGNGLYSRLTDVNPDSFNDRLCDRYTELRSGTLSDAALQARLTDAYELLRDNNVFSREAQRWPDLTDATPERLEATRSFLTARLGFMDAFVCDLSVSTSTPQGAPPIALFPNPARENLTVLQEVPTGGAYRLYDAVGRSVRYGKLSVGGRTTIPLTGLPSGLYTFQLSDRALRVVVQ